MPSDDEMQLCAELDLLYWKRWRIEQDIQLIEQKLISPEDHDANNATFI